MLGGDNYTEQYVVHDGKLANVYVYVKSGPPAAMTARGPVRCAGGDGPGGLPVYAARDCGDARAGLWSFATRMRRCTTSIRCRRWRSNQAIDISQGPKGAPQVKQFNQPEMMMPVRCNNHPWMNAFINVSATPFFAVTDKDGHFDIKGLPAGNLYAGGGPREDGRADDDGDG